MVDAVLVFPPAYYPWFVPPGISYLTAFVRKAGFSVVQRDANVPAIEFNLSLGRLREAGAPEELIARVGYALEVMRNTGAYRDFWPYFEARPGLEHEKNHVGSGSEAAQSQSEQTGLRRSARATSLTFPELA